MGNKSSVAAPASVPPLTANTPNIITKNPTPFVLSTVPTTLIPTMTTTTAPTTTITTTAAGPPTETPTAAATAAATTTARSPTPTVVPTAPALKSTPTTTGASTESTSSPTFYSIVKSLTTDTAKAKSASSAYSHWYRWSKFEKQKRDKGKILWYMTRPVTTTTTTTTSNPTTPTVTTTTEKIDDDRKEVSDPSDIIAVPSFQLRSTAVYSPPHGDRIPSGRNELVNTDTSIFKYYLPENRSKRAAGIHTKATMYKMNTFSRQIPLPAHPSQLSATNANANAARNSASLPTFTSRGLQINAEAQPTDPSSTQVRHFERQPSQLVAVSGLSNYRSSNAGFYHLSSKDTISQPVLPTLEKPSGLSNEPPRASTTQSFPPPPLPPPPPRPSILKNSSAVLPRDMSNPLSDPTHEKILEELRKQNKTTKDGVFRVKKVHLLETAEPESRPAPVLFTRPSRPPSSKASQSILRSEKLLFSDIFNRKK